MILEAKLKSQSFVNHIVKQIVGKYFDKTKLDNGWPKINGIGSIFIITLLFLLLEQ